MVEKEITNVHGVSNACRNGELREGMRVSMLERLDFEDGNLINEPFEIANRYVLHVAELIRDGKFERVSTVVASCAGDYVGVNSTDYYGQGCVAYSKAKRLRGVAA